MTEPFTADQDLGELKAELSCSSEVIQSQRFIFIVLRNTPLPMPSMCYLLNKDSRDKMVSELESAINSPNAENLLGHKKPPTTRPFIQPDTEAGGVQLLALRKGGDRVPNLSITLESEKARELIRWCQAIDLSA